MESRNRIVESPTAAPDLTAGIPLPGISVLDDHRFLTGLRVKQLPNLFLNPHIAENPAILDAMPTVRKFAERRELVQRLMRTQLRKRRNVPSYREYILEVVKGQRMGSMPPIEAWTPEVVIIEVGAAFIPWGEQLVAFDSDTQLAAWFDLIASGDEDVLNYMVPVVLHSARPTEWAQQQLHDRNTYGVKMTASEAMERDSYDQVTTITKTLIERAGLRVATQKRQLGARDPEQLTLSALRQGVLTTLAGRPGIQVGAKPFLLPQGVAVAEAADAVSRSWSVVLDVIGEHLTAEGRKRTVLPAPSVMAGLGVLAHGTMPDSIRRPDVVKISSEDLLERIKPVRWDRQVTLAGGDISFPWEAVAGKANHQLGRFSVGGAKEFAYAVAEALEMPESERGRRVRPEAEAVGG
ncbi:MAG: DNA sulfur modification protein DndB [Candidatus Nanopelagicales bacterium]|nr:DNA sulfur modification protein DndB [Candidatus Nanopelagicales bacterium]